MAEIDLENGEHPVSELAGPMCTALGNLSLGREVEALMNTHVLLAIA